MYVRETFLATEIKGPTGVNAECVAVRFWQDSDHSAVWMEVDLGGYDVKFDFGDAPTLIPVPRAFHDRGGLDEDAELETLIMDKTGEAFIDLDENQLKAWGGDYREALRFFEKNWIEAETEAYGMGVGSISGSLSLMINQIQL